jgi:hypothetical protein
MKKNPEVCKKLHSILSQVSRNFGNNQFLIRIFLPESARGYLQP